MRLKIIICGPKGVGKTAFSNYLAGSSNNLKIDRYDPTAGVRILEVEQKYNGITETFNIELWDSSGDQGYEGCWKAIMHEADGAILMYNPDAPGQDQQIGDWFDFFVRKNGLKDEKCIVFAHRTKQTNDRFRPPPIFSNLTAALTTEQSGQDVKNMFENLIRDIYQSKSRK